MIKKKNVFALLLFSLFLFSCQYGKSKDIEKVLNELNERLVVFPTDLKSITKGNEDLNSILRKGNKIVVYFDSTGCSECKMKLSYWTGVIRQLKDSLPNTSIVFIVTPKKGKMSDLISILKRYDISYPFLVDTLNQFCKQNKLPKDPRFHTFLLNKQNKIVLVGSPVDNDKMWSLYKAYINGSISGKEAGDINKANYSSSKDKGTTIEVDRDSVNFGHINRVNKSAIFRLKNVGTLPLSVQAVNTSCGCTAAKYDKKPIPPGKTTTVTLEYKPNSLGYFHKTADVVCNIPEGFVRLSISGTVVDK